MNLDSVGVALPASVITVHNIDGRALWSSTHAGASRLCEG